MVQRQAEDLEQYELLQRMVLDAIHKYDCRKVKDVVSTLQQLDKSITVEEIHDAINALKDDNKITLSEAHVEGSFSRYITNLYRSASFWLTILVTIVTLATIYLAPAVVPWSIVRIIAGGAFILFMPGYSLLNLLFPTKQIDTTERTALSVGLSLAVTPLIGLMLNYNPVGVRLDSVVVSLSVVSIAFAFGGIYKRFLRQRLL